MSDDPKPAKTTVTADRVIKRRHHMPYWQQGGSVYFITFHSVRGALPEVALKQVIKHVSHDQGRRYDLFFAVIIHHRDPTAKPLNIAR